MLLLNINVLSSVVLCRIGTMRVKRSMRLRQGDGVQVSYSQLNHAVCFDVKTCQRWPVKKNKITIMVKKLLGA